MAAGRLATFKTPGPTAGSQNQFVIREVFFPAGFQVPNVQKLPLAVDGQGLSAGADSDIFGILKKFWSPEHVKAGAHQLFNVAKIARDIIGDATAAVRDVFALINHGDPIIGAQAFQAAGDLGSQGYGPDNDYPFRFHVVSSLWLICSKICDATREDGNLHPPSQPSPLVGMAPMSDSS
jgi:hypothetical protein